MQELSGELVYADESIVVLDKPAGLLCVPGRGADKQDCLSLRVQALFPDALIVHRLDMATSGLCVMARSAVVQRRLSIAFAAREVHKRYIAVVAGRPSPLPDDEGWSLIDLPIAADWPRRPLHVIDHERGKPSQTRWRPLDFLPPPVGEGRGGGDAGMPTTRLELAPLTGRTHQLRLHLQAIGHPILGDALYAPPHVQTLSPRLLLHASELRFIHPQTGDTVHFERPAPF